MLEAEFHPKLDHIVKRIPHASALVAGALFRVGSFLACPGDDIAAATLAATQVAPQSDRVEAVLPPEDNFKPRLTKEEDKKVLV